MDRYKKLKEEMIKSHLMNRDITDDSILRAFWYVERHHFVDEILHEKSYSDSAVPIQNTQTLSQPYIVAKMTQELELSGRMKILEIGTGSGFQTSILAFLGHDVYTIEIHKVLQDQAIKRFIEFGFKVNTMVGDGTIGWPKHAPFDRIIITAGAPGVPDSLFEQLSENGIMILPAGDRKEQKLLKIRKQNGEQIIESLVDCKFVPLVGKEGWSL